MSVTNEYELLVHQVAKDVCEKNSVPTCACYSRAVAEKLNQKRGTPVEPRRIRLSIGKILKKLSQNGGDFICAGKGYYPNMQLYRFSYYGELIEKRIRFASEDIYAISEDICIVTLAKSHTGNDVTTKEILKLFENYIGDNCYLLKIVDNYLIIMLRKGVSEDETSIGDIERIVKKTFAKKPPKRRIRKKRTVKDILGAGYQYYYFDQKATPKIGDEQTKRFMTLECDAELVTDVSDILAEMKNAPYESFYCGHNSVVVVFDITKSTDNFDNFLKRIEDDGEALKTLE